MKEQMFLQGGVSAFHVSFARESSERLIIFQDDDAMQVPFCN